MSLQPDRLFLSSSTLLYFSAGLWTAFSLSALAIRPTARGLFAVILGVVLIVAATGWCAVSVVLLASGTNPFQLPLIIVLALILVFGLCYFPLKPWSRNTVDSIPNYASTARLELLGLVVGLPVVSLIKTAPFGTAIFGWLPTLLDSNVATCVLIIALAVGTLALSTPKIRGILSALAVIVLLLAATYVVMLTALIATI